MPNYELVTQPLLLNDILPPEPIPDRTVRGGGLALLFDFITGNPIVGNPAPVGTFADGSSLRTGVGTDLIMVSGTVIAGDSGAGRLFAYSASVDAAYVASHPTTSFLDKNGRGFYEVPSGAVISPTAFAALLFSTIAALPDEANGGTVPTHGLYLSAGVLKVNP